MEWLEIIQMQKPIEDVGEYLNHVSRWPLFVNMASAAICMGISAVYHLFFVYSTGAYSFLAKLDYTGIVILCFGSAVSPTMYTYACSDVAHLRNFFMGCLIFTSVTVFLFTTLPYFARNDLKWLRGTMFVIFGISVSFPLLYSKFLFEESLILDTDVFLFALGGAFYIAGAVLYSTKVPERCKPGAYDICGHSHQIFHVCVFIGALIHYFESLKCFYRRQTHFCPIK